MVRLTYAGTLLAMGRSGEAERLVVEVLSAEPEQPGRARYLGDCRGGRCPCRTGCHDDEAH